MLLRVGQTPFLLPLSAIESSFRPGVHPQARLAAAGEVVLLRGTPLPIIDLHERFSLPCDAEPILIAVRSAARRCALRVTELIGQRQIVIRPLGHGVGRVPGICGATVLGDGRVGLVIDVRDLLPAEENLTAPEARSAG
jgi:two-component system chemotaxis sensor kinase CheA